MQIFKFASRELRNQKSTVFLFSFSLALGLLAFFSVNSFKTAVQDQLAQQSKSILGADIGIGSRHPLKPEIIEKALQTIAGDFETKSEMIETYTMLVSESRSRLVEVKGIEDSYPFYGEMKLENSSLGGNNNYRLSTREALVFPETLAQLNLQVGDSFSLVGQNFKIAESILNDPAAIGSGFNFAPTIYVRLDDLKASDLIRPGSTGYFSLLFKLKDGVNSRDVAERLRSSIADTAVRILTPESTSQQVGRLTRYLSDYLSLAGLVALILAVLACGYLYKTYLERNSKVIATYKILGFLESDVRRMFVQQALILFLLAYLVSALIAKSLLPWLSDFGSSLLNMPMEVHLSPSTLIEGAVIGILASVLITYPFIRVLDRIEPKKLVQQQPTTYPFRRSDLFFFIPLVGVLLVLAFSLTYSNQSSAYFLVGILASALIIFLLTIFVAALVRSIGDFNSFFLNWIRKSLLGHLGEFRFSYFCLSIGLILILLLPMLQAGIQNELQAPNSANTPSLFLFDIQKDQYGPLSNFLSQSEAVVQNMSPLIRSRLTAINGKPFEPAQSLTNSAEADEENRMRNRGYNLTYREKLSEAERVTEGKFWDGPAAADQIPEISVESRFAERLGLFMNDVLEFDVEGQVVKGKITSIRRVRWTSFQPNFFLQLQPHPSVLELPHTFIIAIKTPLDRVPNLQNQLADKFPGISIIDVNRLAENLNAVVTQLSAALKLVGLTSLIVGLLIFFAMINHRAVEKRRQVNLLRVLGAGSRQIYISTLGEFLILIALALITGAFLSSFLNASLLKLVFDSLPQAGWASVMATVSGLVLASLVVAYLAIRRALTGNPNELLKES